MSPGIKEEWRMRAIPIEEAAKEVWTRHAKEEWMERGREEGMEAEKVEVARKMLAKSVPVETIAEYTGLDKGHIQALI
jgi:predicted transposase/invertase (TIGR01784 family)